jgi:cardiolipin synthase
MMWLAPNSITAIRLLAIPVIIYDLGCGYWSRALIVIVLFAALDLLDGYIARRFEAVSKFGACFDSLTDRTLAIAIVVVLWMIPTIPLPLLSLMTLLNIIHLCVSAYYAWRGSAFPKTSLGPFIGASTFAAAAPLHDEEKLYFGLLALTLTINHLFYYTAPAISSYMRQRQLRRRLVRFGGIGTKIIKAARVYCISRRVAGDSRIITIPNLLTCARALLIPPIGYLIAQEQFVTAVELSAAFYALDVADGALARAWNQVSRIGKVLDACIDKLAVLTISGGLLWIGLLPVELAVLIGFRIGAVACVARWLFTGGIPLPWAFWSFPANGAVVVYVCYPSRVALLAAILLNLQSLVNYTYQAYRNAQISAASICQPSST